MRSFTLSLTLCLLSYFSFSQTNWINFVDDGDVKAIAFENETIWAATQGGLLKINKLTGEREIFQPWNSGLSGVSLESVIVAPNGDKWIGGNQGGLFRFNNNEWEHFYEVDNGETLEYILKMEASPAGDIWFVSNVTENCFGCRRLFSFDGNEFIRHDFNFGIPINNSDHPIDFSVVDDDEIWVAKRHILFQYDGENIISQFDETNSPLVADEQIVAIHADSENNIWVGTRHFLNLDFQARVLKYNGNEWSIENGTCEGTPFSIHESPAGDIYIQEYASSPYTSIIGKYSDGNLTYFEGANLVNIPFSWNGPRLLHVDEEENWWTIINTGNSDDDILYKFDGENWEGINTRIYPFISNSWESIETDCDNRVWVGGDGVVIYEDNTWTHIDRETIGGTGSISSITLDDNTCDIWLTIDNSQNGIGLSRYNGVEFITYEIEGGDADKLTIDNDGIVWIATSQNGVGKFDGTNWEWYNESNSILDDYIINIEADIAGNIWISQITGELIKFDGDSGWQVFDSSNSPVSNSNWWIFNDNNGMIWTSYELGIMRYNGLEWETFQIDDEVIFITGMAQDQNNNFWLAGQNNSFFWDGINFTPIDINNSSIADNVTRTVEIDNYGNKWFLFFSQSGITVHNENGISNRITNPGPNISGTVFFDFDQDGLQGTLNEPFLPGQKVNLTQGNIKAITNSLGKYTYYPEPGEYEISIEPEYPYVPTTTSPLEINLQSLSISDLDFGIWNPHPEDSVSFDLTASFARCNQEMNLWARFCNYGVIDTEGSIEINFDPSLIYISAFPEPTSIQGNTVIYEFDDLAYYNCESVKIILQVPGVDQLGEELIFTGTAISGGGGLYNEVNDETSVEINCSFDPNDKRAEPTGDFVNEYSLLGDALDYTIRFQNKGNDTAFIVVIRDTLDTDLDFSTFHILGNSHEMETILDEHGVVTFTFRDINLLWEDIDDAGSQGFVKYRISPKDNLPDPTLIENTAHIYFDFNPAIVTNTTENILVETLPFISSSPETLEDNQVHISPNPSNGSINIDIVQNFTPYEKSEINIYDLTGRNVLRQSLQNKMTTIRNLDKGFYIISLKWNNKLVSKKIIVH